MGLLDKIKKQKVTLETQPYNIATPVEGIVIDIRETKDPLFSEESLGKGVGIIAQNKIIVAPANGTISSFFPTKHAIGITTNEGVDILIHVGIDTVELQGEFFKKLKNQGDSVVRGEALLEVDFDSIKARGYDETVMMVVTNSAEYKNINLNLGQKEKLDIVIEIEK